MGHIRDLTVQALLDHPEQIWKVFDDSENVLFLVSPARHRRSLHLQSVPLWVWLEVERFCIALIVFSGGPCVGLDMRS